MPISTTLSHPRQTRMLPQANSVSNMPTSPSNRHTIYSSTTAVVREYIFNRMVRHIGSGPSPTYVVSWYGYTPKDDTIEPPEYILQHIIPWHWRRIQVQQTTNPRNVTLDGATCISVPHNNNTLRLHILSYQIRLIRTQFYAKMQSSISHTTHPYTADPNTGRAKTQNNVNIIDGLGIVIFACPSIFSFRKSKTNTR